MEVYTVAFFGHRILNSNLFQLEERLEAHICTLLCKHEYVEFLVGRNGEFDICAASVVLRCKDKYRNDNNSLVLILPYMTAEYENNKNSFCNYYDEVEISAAASTAHPKSAIQLRNREMVDRADLILCGIERKSGGAWQTIKYAQTRGKQIINLF